MNEDISDFKKNISRISHSKKTKIILALDILESHNILERAIEIIDKVSPYICGIKINYHLILPLSSDNLVELNNYIHSHNLVSIADIKLNDIENTNLVALNHLFQMGFDAVIVNPFIGLASLRRIVKHARENKKGIISLVFVSHEGAEEGYGLQVIHKEKETMPLFKIFLQNSIICDVDGIVVGATKTEIFKSLYNHEHPPIYSPGIGAQGGIIDSILKRKVSFIIVGRSILNATRIEDKLLQLSKEIDYP